MFSQDRLLLEEQLVRYELHVLHNSLEVRVVLTVSGESVLLVLRMISSSRWEEEKRVCFLKRF